LTVLRAVARHGTVTAAAEVCHLTPSAVSHQLQALARELDVVLLEHTGRNVRLTAAANTLLTHADALAAGWERAQADLAAYRSSTITGLLRWARLPGDYPIMRIPLSEQPAPMRHILAAVRAGSSYQPAIAAGLAALREIAARKREDAGGF